MNLFDTSLLQDLQAPGLGQGTRDLLELPLADPTGSQGCHVSKVSRHLMAGNGEAEDSTGLHLERPSLSTAGRIRLRWQEERGYRAHPDQAE